MRKLSKVIALCALVLSITAIVLWFVAKPQIGFVDNYALFEQFDYKIELESKLDESKLIKQTQIDSMRFALNQYKESLDTAKIEELKKFELFNVKKNEYLRIEQEYTSQIEEHSSAYDRMIFDRINLYVRAYAEEQGMDLLIGHSGEGTIMYGKEKLDKTSDVINYMNLHYANENQ